MSAPVGDVEVDPPTAAIPRHAADKPTWTEWARTWLPSHEGGDYSGVDRVLLGLYLIFQAYASVKIVQLALWAQLQNVEAALPALGVDGCALVLAVIWADRSRGAVIRGVAGFLSVCLFAVSVCATLLAKRVHQTEVVAWWDGHRDDIALGLAVAPTVLVGVIIVMRLAIAAERRQEAADAAAAAEEAERVKAEQQRADDEAEQQRRRELADLERERLAADEREREAARAERERRRAERDAAPSRSRKQSPPPAGKARRESLPVRGRRYVLQHIADEGVAPKSPAVNEAIGAGDPKAGKDVLKQLATEGLLGAAGPSGDREVLDVDGCARALAELGGEVRKLTAVGG